MNALAGTAALRARRAPPGTALASYDARSPEIRDAAETIARAYVKIITPGGPPARPDADRPPPRRARRPVRPLMMGGRGPVP